MDLRVKQLAKLREIPSPEDGLRSIVERAPQAEAWLDRLKLQMQPALSTIYSARRKLATGGVMLLTAWLFLHVMFGANGMVVYKQKRSEYQTLQKEIDALQTQNDQYGQRINALKTDPKAIEKEAREQLQYAKPGEVIYVNPTPAPPKPPQNHSAKK